VYQAGTLAGNPLAMSAGIATLKQLSAPGIYHDISEKADRLARGLRRALVEAKIPGQVNSTGSLRTLFFAARPGIDYAGAKSSHTRRYAHFFREMLERGIFLAPSQFEAAFVSTAHIFEDIDFTIKAARESLEAIAAEGSI